MNRYIPILLAGLVLAACAGPTPKATAYTSIADACGGYASAIDQLTPIKAKLDAQTVAAVNVTNSLTGPLCHSGTAVPADTASAITFVAGETAAILAIVHGVH